MNSTATVPSESRGELDPNYLILLEFSGFSTRQLGQNEHWCSDGGHVTGTKSQVQDLRTCAAGRAEGTLQTV